MSNSLETYPVLKASDTGSPSSHIYFDELVELPDGTAAQIYFEFERGNSFDEMRELIAILKQKRFKFVIAPPPGQKGFPKIPKH